MLSLYNLPGQLPNEKVIRVWRKDIFVFIEKAFYILIFAILPFLFFSKLYRILKVYDLEALLVLASSFYYLFLWLFFFFFFLDYYLDIWIITNKRIIDIEQRGFFSRIIAEQRLYRIQDVTSEVNGLLPTILNYGNVFIQTAGTVQRFSLNKVSHPDEVRDTIIKMAEYDKKQVQNKSNL